MNILEKAPSPQNLKITKAKKTISEITNTAKGCFVGESSKHNKYRFTLTNKATKQVYWSIFWDSINNTEKGILPNEYDILACLSVDYSVNFQDFCDNFGYDTEIWNNQDRLVRNASAYHTYKAVKNQSESLQRLLTEEQLEQLHEIS